MAAELKALKAQMRLLANDQSEIREQVDALSPKPEPILPSAPNDLQAKDQERGDASKPGPSQAQVDDPVTGQWEHLEAALEEDAVDPIWARSAESSLQDAPNSSALGVNHVTATCRSKLCRIDLSFNSGQSDSDGPMAAIGKLPWTAQTFIESQLDGKSSRIYVVREGSSLP
jgi:hypothetical protein